jgi:hypothetical protein
VLYFTRIADKSGHYDGPNDEGLVGDDDLSMEGNYFLIQDMRPPSISLVRTHERPPV